MRELAEYGAARAVEAALSALPGPTARRAGEALGRLARGPLAIRRQVVERHLARSFPERDREWVERTTRGCYRHFGREVAAVLRSSRLDPSGLLDRTTDTEGAAAVLGTAVEEGPGALVVTGHLGNWELAGAVMAALGFSVSAVVKRQGNARVHRRLGRLRRRLGVEPVEMSAAGRRIPDALRAGRIVALVADQDAGHRGIFVPFLGRPASTFRGPARLALRHRVPLIFGALVREEGRYRALARRVWGPGDGGPDVGEQALTATWVSELERAVRARPRQYFWFHRRWKTRPDPDRDPS